MPPPFLVDVDGNPHPIHYQRLVPGHGSNVSAPARNAEPPPTPSDELPPLLAEIQAAERERVGGVGNLGETESRVQCCFSPRISTSSSLSCLYYKILEFRTYISQGREGIF